MQSTSDIYKDLLIRGATKEVRVEIGGEIYEEDRLVNMASVRSLFSEETLCVGSAVSGQIDLTLINYGIIPRMAKIVPSYRLVLGEEMSEWIQKGVYYIDTRQPDKASGTLAIHGFDDMLKGSVIWNPDQSLEFPMTRRAAASVIASAMGVELDNPEDIDDTQSIVEYPANDYTQRNILQFIAASHAANFVMTDAGKLRMVTINDYPADTGFLVNEAGSEILIGGIRVIVSDADENKVTGRGSKTFVGQNVESTGAAPSFEPISKIIVKVDQENAWVSGDDSGTVLELTCPYGSQTMADELLSKVGGFVYQPFTADGALVDNAIELGDGITVDGVYTMLAKQEITFDGLMAGVVSAPGEYEVESEYPYQTRDQQIEYKLAASRSLISKKAEEIRLEVSKKVGESEVKSLISTEVGKIRLSVSSADGSTTFTLTDQNATLSTQTLNLSVPAVNISGQLRASQIDATNLQVNAANVTGYLSANKLSLDGPMALTSGSSVYGYMGVNTIKGGPVLCDSTDSVFFVATPSAAKMSYHEEKMMWVHSGGCYTSETIQVYSDARLKNSINYDMSDVEKVFPLLRPCSFKMNVDGEKAKTHWGFIAQDFIEAAEEAGLDPSSLAILGEYDGLHSIGYGEMPVVNTLMIQHLMSRVAALESKLEG